MTVLALIVVLVALAAGAVIAWHRRARTVAACLALAAAAGTAIALANAPFYVQALTAAAAIAAAWVWLLRRGRTSAVVTRMGDRTRRTAGVATTLDIVRVASAPAMRRKAAAVRPHLRGTTRLQRARTPVTEVAVRLCRTSGLDVHASLEDVVTIFGGPRVGKTGWLAGAIIDHPGAVLSTSTRLDLMENTRPAREKRGPVYVFNPGGVGDLPSTIKFDPLSGCTNTVIATERAADMLPESDGAGDRSYWEGRARTTLAAFLHAAAIGGLHMTDVLSWVADPDGAQSRVLHLLRKSTQPAWVEATKQFCGTNDKTRSSITSSIMPALGWLTSPAAVDAATGDGEPFDVAKLLRDRGTVYLLGRHETHTAALLGAFTGYVAREARRLAALQPGGRLDPPPGLFLDEAARVVPVPLPDWTGDFGGSGIFICPAFQSRADILDRYGPTGAAKILNNSGSIMLFGGTKDTGDLDQWSKLAGDRDEVVKTLGKDGKVTSTSVRKAPVLSVAQLANLPKQRAVVFSRGMPPAIGRVQMVWERRSVRQPWWWRVLDRARSRVATPAPAPAPAGGWEKTSAPAPAPAALPLPVAPAPAGGSNTAPAPAPAPAPAGVAEPAPAPAPAPTREPVGASRP